MFENTVTDAAAVQICATDH